MIRAKGPGFALGVEDMRPLFRAWPPGEEAPAKAEKRRRAGKTR